MTRSARPLRLVQGLQARVPDRRRHGEHEDRVPAPLPQAPARCPLQDKLVAHLPRYARRAAALAPLLNLRDRVPGLAALTEALAGFAARRSLPRWRRDWFRGQSEVPAPRRAAAARATRARRRPLRRHLQPYFEPENLRAAVARPRGGGLSGARSRRRRGRAALLRPHVSRAGLVDEARAEARARSPRCRRSSRAASRSSGSSRPACSAFGTSFGRCCPARGSAALAAAALMFEEFLVREQRGRALQARSSSRPRYARALVHGHCHQKAFGVMPSVVDDAQARPGARGRDDRVELLRHGGRFGYEAQTSSTSRCAMAELSLLPAVRAAGADTPHRRRRHELPAPDPRRRRARSGACRARARGVLTRVGLSSAGLGSAGHRELADRVADSHVAGRENTCVDPAQL